MCIPSFSSCLAFITILTILLVPTILSHYFYAYAAYIKAVPVAGGPTINDPNLKVQVVFKGLRIPTSIAFLGPNDIVVLEKNSGNVLRIVGGHVLKQPLLHVDIATPFVEWGLLGIAISKPMNTTDNENSSNNSNNDGNTKVFLYYTESGGSPVNDQLINPELLLDLPSNAPNPLSESNHNGGKVLIGPDNNVYTVTGDVGGHNGQAQNVLSGVAPDGTSGILRVTQDGQPVPNNPLIGNGASNDDGNDDGHTKHGKHGKGSSSNKFSSSALINDYFAYGIRNSFGIDFDPVTGNLWDTENGPVYGDEINLVQPGFNSGWNQIMGIWQTSGPTPGPVVENPQKQLDLVAFNGKGTYRSPEFVWQQPVGPTALKFLNSDKLGKQYQNTMFVGDVDTGNLYNFRLNEDRTGLSHRSA